MADRSAFRRWFPGAQGVVVALLVFVGCYAGALAGTIAEFPGIRTAILFPPYAVLAAALMMSPVRRWWLYVLASMAGNFWPHRQHDGLTSFVLMAEVANVTRAVIAAGGVRALGWRHGWFETFRGTIGFLSVAGIVAPAAAAVIGAATVQAHNPSADFWTLWQAWSLSNVLTGLTLLPLILCACEAGRAWLQGEASVNAPRLVEGGVLSIGVLALGAYMFALSHSGVVPASLYAPLPLLLWAAVRFGPGGTVAALTALTGLTIAGARNGNGPFVAQSPADNLIQLQCFLIALCIPMVLLASIVRQQARTTESLRQGEEALRASFARVQELAGRLIAAQEDERTRIARDLHDDFSQRLAAVAVGLGGLRRRSRDDAQEQIGSLQRTLSELTSEMRELSHELHPGVLQHAGLGPALAARAAEFQRLHGIEVTVDAADCGEIPPSESVCLYRVAQETLHNVARHAQAGRVHISVSRADGGIRLSVQDDGRGFDAHRVRARGGLGLTSLAERVRLVGGSMIIESRPSGGTQVSVQIPFGEREHDHPAG